MKKLLLIDTFNFLHRAYHALPKTFTDGNGNPTNAIYGVTSMLINIFDALEPDYAVAALDSIEPTFRVEDFTAYKAHRKPMEDTLAAQIEPVFDIIDAFGVKKVTVNGYEADDIIGTMVTRFSGPAGAKKEPVESIIASNDRDLWQLVAKDVIVMLPATKGTDEWIGEKEVEARMELTPSQIPDYKGLRGDQSDNIPGVHGVGEKTATALIKQFGSLEAIYQNLPAVEPKSLRKKLEENYETALLSKKLATIITDVPVTMELAECKYSKFNKLEVKEVLEKYNFKSLITRLGFEPAKSNTKKSTPVAPPNQIGLF